MSLEERREAEEEELGSGTKLAKGLTAFGGAVLGLGGRLGAERWPCAVLGRSTEADASAAELRSARADAVEKGAVVSIGMSLASRSSMAEARNSSAGASERGKASEFADVQLRPNA